MYEVKNVKTFIGTEGHGFNANLYCDGKKVAFVIDSAHGGCYDYEWVSDAARVKAEAHVKTLPGVEMYGTKLEMDMDIFMSELIDAYEEKKQITRMKKTYVVFKTPDCGPGEIYKIAHKGDVEGCTKRAMAKYPNAVFL